jgi:hypothetical protein
MKLVNVSQPGQVARTWGTRPIASEFFHDIDVSTRIAYLVSEWLRLLRQ